MGREHYRGLAGIDWAGLPRLLVTEIGQFTSNVQGFRNHALAELGRLTKARFVAEAQRLVPEVRATDLIRSSKVGIRAQLFDLKAKRLVDDFLVERSANALHVLNAVSPGFTSAFALARHLAELVEA